MITRFRIHACVAACSVLLTVPALLWWKQSVLFVIALSLFANFYAAVSALEAADDSTVLGRLEEMEAKLDLALAHQTTPDDTGSH